MEFCQMLSSVVVFVVHLCMYAFSFSNCDENFSPDSGISLNPELHIRSSILMSSLSSYVSRGVSLLITSRTITKKQDSGITYLDQQFMDDIHLVVRTALSLRNFALCSGESRLLASF